MHTVLAGTILRHPGLVGDVQNARTAKSSKSNKIGRLPVHDLILKYCQCGSEPLDIALLGMVLSSDDLLALLYRLPLSSASKLKLPPSWGLKELTEAGVRPLCSSTSCDCTTRAEGTGTLNVVVDHETVYGLWGIIIIDVHECQIFIK